jgi:beta-glucosidase-like glycosyl hydrolase/CubicO group peptidase (beta-lactamase class C family)
VKKKRIILLIAFVLGMQFMSAQSQKFMLDIHHPWVDSVFATLSQDEQIAQLLYVAAYSNRGVEHEVEITDLIRKYKIGGLIFFQGDPATQAELTNFYQSESEVPLMIAMDGEWGLGMRLDGMIDFPYQMTLGAIQDESLIYQMGKEVAHQFKRLGVHLNLAPVVDVNNNPNNPVINFRSFGSDKENVARKGTEYMKGMQDHGILACAKHYPGHGDTDTDSHLDLPVIRHDRQRIHDVELYPFRELIDAGVASIMPTHISIPSLDSTPNLPATLSVPIVTDLLQEEMGFEGLVVTDALNMKGVTKFFPPGVVDAKALIAGNDVLEFTEDVEKAIAEIKKAANEGVISWGLIEKRCRRVLAAKQRVGLDHFQPVEIENIVEDLNPPSAHVLNRRLYEAALTVLSNADDILPVGNLESTRIATLGLQAVRPTAFQNMLDKYTRMDHYTWDPGNPQADSVFKKLEDYDLVIAGITGMNQRPYRNFDLHESLPDALSRLQGLPNVILTVFGNPYALDRMPGVEQFSGLVVAYQDNSTVQKIAAQMVFGAISASGKLPVAVNDHFRLGDGLTVNAIDRLAYSLPEALGMNGDFLEKKIDSIASAGIEAGAFPGCQVLVAKNGVVVFHKTYGYHTYEKRTPVKKEDLFDFASVTKITGSLPAIMQLHDQGKFDLDVPFSTYWPDFKRSNKSELTVREILAHQSGMIAWIPYWRNTVKKSGRFKCHTFKKDSIRKYTVPVIEDLYLHSNYLRKMDRAIRKSEVSEEKKYLYSGLSFYLYPRIIENLTGENYENYIKKHVYQPIGAYTLTYNPYRLYPVQRIVPTEHDTFFRKKQIHGYVHDEGAAMMGGVSGNAGLFGTANDLAKLMQMYMQMGFYGGEQIISQPTMNAFTSYQYPGNDNRRGLGFDKPLVNNKTLPAEEAYPAQSASHSSFGHSGYTGTFTWADPEAEIVYVFFSNRVYPTRENQRIYQMNIRTSIQEAIYQSIME